MKLEKRRALITGGGSGLGREIARVFAAEGAAIAINDLRRAAAQQVAEELRAEGAEVMVCVADVSDSVEVGAMFEDISEQWDGLDILVNNAGIASAAVEEALAQGPGLVGNTQSTSDSEWRRMLAVHLDGTFYCLRAALRLMEPQGHGKIINMASVAGLSGLPGAPGYSAAKAGIIGLTKSVAREVIARGIYVNAIAPGFVDTPLLDGMDDSMKQWLASLAPIGRFGTPAEVAALALYLASEESSYTVGQVFSPNGGIHT